MKINFEDEQTENKQKQENKKNKEWFKGFNFESKKVSKKQKILEVFIYIISIFILNFFILMPISPTFNLILWAVLLVLILRIFIKSSNGRNITFTIIILSSIFLPSLISAPIFHADKYYSLIGEVNEELYTENVAAAQIQELPVVDQDLANQLADKKLGEDAGLGSQFHVGEMNLIAVNNELVWVGPLEPNDFIKWLTTNRQIPGYIIVSATNPNDVELVTNVDGEDLTIKYSQESYFLRDIKRHAYYNASMWHGLVDFAFELDDTGRPYYVISMYHKTIGIFGGNEVESVFIIDAQTGLVEEYQVGDTPDWVDRVYPQDLVLSQLQYYGLYGLGFLNSLIAQKSVITPTGNGAYVYYEGVPHYYVGMTSIASDESTVGFMLVNTQTKETTFYPMTGATEYSSMSSAQGAVQDLGYRATYPIIINLSGVPTYFMTLKDESGLVKQYAFVNVENYSIVGTGLTLSEAQNNYNNSLSSQGGINLVVDEDNTYEYTINRINFQVMNNVTYYYFTVNEVDTIFMAAASVNDEIILTEPGDTIKISYLPSDQQTITVDIFENLSIN